MTHDPHPEFVTPVQGDTGFRAKRVLRRFRVRRKEETDEVAGKTTKAEARPKTWKHWWPIPTNTFGGRLFSARRQRGYTACGLARMVAVSESFLSEMENDHSMPNGDILIRLRKVLGVSVDWLLVGRPADFCLRRKGGKR